MIFLWLLQVLLVVGWLGGGIALVVEPLRMFRKDDEDLGGYMTALLIGCGLALILSFGAVVTGEIVLGNHPDGCYYLHTELVGKTIVQEYDPIVCPVTPQ